jgi:transcriptional regulator with XRE-family HTH domain
VIEGFTAMRGRCKAEKCRKRMEPRKMLTLDEIRAGLKDRQPGKVAAAVGVHPTTISAIREGRRSPRYAVAKALSDYLMGGVVCG